MDGTKQTVCIFVAEICLSVLNCFEEYKCDVMLLLISFYWQYITCGR